ncbi:hypothetical protein [Aeromicrobium sp. NPDC092404]|uniref:hypothetical protein n=1 Tax=Aeromicrobium sp. NPDC092404 TaxID=3154976 RepID=UPI003432FE3A
MTRTLRLLLVTAAALLLAACPGPAKQDLKPNATDRARVDRIAKDPWAAPTRTMLPRQSYGSNGQLDRQAGERSTNVAGSDSRPIVAKEVEAATADGWELVAADCDEDDGHVRSVQLSRGDSLGTFARAIITASPDSSTAEDSYDVTVKVFVPHHVDKGWPQPPALQPEDTCLADPAKPSDEVEDVRSGKRFGPS